MDPKMVQGAVRAHLDAMSDVDEKNTRDICERLRGGHRSSRQADCVCEAGRDPESFQCSAPGTKPQRGLVRRRAYGGCREIVPGFFGDGSRSEALSAEGAGADTLKGPAAGPPFDLW